MTQDFEVRFGSDQRWTVWRGWPPMCVMQALAALQGARESGAGR